MGASPRGRRAAAGPADREDLPGSFTGTALEQWLRERGITTVAIAGYMTHMCCDTTARQAVHRGFNVEFLSDATGTLPLSNSGGPGDGRGAAPVDPLRPADAPERGPAVVRVDRAALTRPEPGTSSHGLGRGRFFGIATRHAILQGNQGRFLLAGHPTSMILYDRNRWFNAVFSWRGTALRRAKWRVLSMTAVRLHHPGCV